MKLIPESVPENVTAAAKKSIPRFCNSIQWLGCYWYFSFSARDDNSFEKIQFKPEFNDVAQRRGAWTCKIHHVRQWGRRVSEGGGLFVVYFYCSSMKINALGALEQTQKCTFLAVYLEKIHEENSPKWSVLKLRRGRKFTQKSISVAPFNITYVVAGKMLHILNNFSFYYALRNAQHSYLCLCM